MCVGVFPSCPCYPLRPEPRLARTSSGAVTKLTPTRFRRYLLRSSLIGPFRLPSEIADLLDAKLPQLSLGQPCRLAQVVKLAHMRVSPPRVGISRRRRLKQDRPAEWVGGPGKDLGRSCGLEARSTPVEGAEYHKNIWEEGRFSVGAGAFSCVRFSRGGGGGGCGKYCRNIGDLGKIACGGGKIACGGERCAV